MLIGAVKVVFAPVPAIGRPSVPRMYPGIEAIEISSVSRWWLVLENQDWRSVPLIDSFAHAVPVGVSALGGNEDDRPALISYVGVVARRVGSDITAVCLVEGLQCLLSSLSVVLLCLVIHQADVKVAIC